MAHQTKIATCCYCGRRTTLRLTARDGHELACGACGAPLHEMKPIKATPHKAPKPEPKSYAPARPAKRKKVKKRKPIWKKALGEAFDLIEDIFD